METLSLKEVQNREHDILRFIVRMCKEHNLRYYLCAGTLLGAIRHKGFIPWDDDIDIMMPRPDYEKLIDLFEQTNNKQYKALHPKCKDYPYSYAKIVDTHTELQEKDIVPIKNMGLWVDIFPLDGVKDDKPSAMKRFIFFINKCRNAATYDKLPEKHRGQKLQWIICRAFGARFFSKIIIYFSKRYQFDACEFNAHIPSSIKYLHKRDWFETELEVDFEDAKYSVPCGYDNYLKLLYGDYMTLPPIEKRATHCIQVVIKNKNNENICSNKL